MSYDQPTAPNAGCFHKEADHHHGTNACYSLDKCRCPDCKAARKRYDRHRAKWVGEYPITKPPQVDAEEARAHVLSLMDQGMGPKRVAQVSGVPHGAISKLIYGGYKRKSPPSKRIRRETEQKLLAVELDLSDGTSVDATEAWAIVEELLARGWWKAEIGRRMTGPDAFSLQMGETQVFAGTLRTLRRLLTEPVPDRVHSPTGKLYNPATDHQWQTIHPTTPGVPDPADTVKPHSPEWLAVMRKGLWEALEMAKARNARRYVA